MFSLFRLAQLAAPEIEQAGGGAILAITSMAAENKNQRMASYGSSKAATSHLVRNIAFDLGPRHIRVNAVAPGATRTDALQSVLTPEIEARMLSHTPIKRLGEPQDMAMPPCFCVHPPPVGSVAKSSPSRAGAYKSWTKARHKKAASAACYFFASSYDPKAWTHRVRLRQLTACRIQSI